MRLNSQGLLYILTMLLGCVHPADNAGTGGACPAPKILVVGGNGSGTGSYGKYHEGCRRHYGPGSCAVRVILKPKINHTSVVCRRIGNA